MRCTTLQSILDEVLVKELTKRYGAIRFIIDDVCECRYINFHRYRLRNLY